MATSKRSKKSTDVDDTKAVHSSYGDEFVSNESDSNK